MGLSETDLYYNSFEKYLSKNSELKLLDKEIQLFKYQKHEENRKKFIEEAKKTRKELKKKQKKYLEKGDNLNKAQLFKAAYEQKQRTEILDEGHKILFFDEKVNSEEETTHYEPNGKYWIMKIMK